MTTRQPPIERKPPFTGLKIYIAKSGKEKKGERKQKISTLNSVSFLISLQMSESRHAFTREEIFFFFFGPISVNCCKNNNTIVQYIHTYSMGKREAKL